MSDECNLKAIRGAPILVRIRNESKDLVDQKLPGGQIIKKQKHNLEHPMGLKIKIPYDKDPSLQPTLYTVLINHSFHHHTK